MINLEKIKLRKCQLLPSLQEDPPLHHTSTTFFNFSDPPLRRSQLKFTPPPPPLQKGGAQHMNTHIGSSKVKVKFPET